MVSKAHKTSHKIVGVLTWKHAEIVVSAHEIHGPFHRVPFEFGDYVTPRTDSVPIVLVRDRLMAVYDSLGVSCGQEEEEIEEGFVGFVPGASGSCLSGPFLAVNEASHLAPDVVSVDMCRDEDVLLPLGEFGGFPAEFGHIFYGLVVDEDFVAHLACFVDPGLLNFGF